MIRVSDIMTSDVITVEPELTLKEAAAHLADHGVGGAPVLAASEVVGVLSTTDILAFGSATPGAPVGEVGATERGEWVEPDERTTPEEGAATYFMDFWENAGADVLERFSSSGAPEWDVLAEHTVSEALSRTLYDVSPDATVAEAAHKIERGIHRLLVTDEGGHLQGIVTAMDVVRGVAEGRI